MTLTSTLFRKPREAPVLVMSVARKRPSPIGPPFARVLPPSQSNKDAEENTLEDAEGTHFRDQSKGTKRNPLRSLASTKHTAEQISSPAMQRRPRALPSPMPSLTCDTVRCLPRRAWLPCSRTEPHGPGLPWPAPLPYPCIIHAQTKPVPDKGCAKPGQGNVKDT